MSWLAFFVDAAGSRNIGAACTAAITNEVTDERLRTSTGAWRPRHANDVGSST
jgi:hypothetical protein